MTTRQANRWRWWFVLFLILGGASLRVLRHYGLIDLPPNFAPVSALAMFSSAYLPRRLAVIVPLGLMFISDMAIGFYSWPIMISVYGSFLVSCALGFWVRHRPESLSLGPRGWRRLAGAALAGAAFFFLVTNAAVWWFGTLYPHTWPGLVAAYVAGWPFFRYTLLGDLFYSGLFFGLHHTVVLYLGQRQRAANSALING
ncbi:MAG: hypothetical protein HYY50_04370 [Candidatus Kerfeldbacteria bacterium]|nr:hypothetical protein [Candidatus Kerfeldbacteria bacterium]